jgi:hypothetical protein
MLGRRLGGEDSLASFVPDAGRTLIRPTDRISAAAGTDQTNFLDSFRFAMVPGGPEEGVASHGLQRNERMSVL